MKFINFINQRKVLIPLIAASSAVLLALIVWAVWLGRGETAAPDQTLLSPSGTVEEPPTGTGGAGDPDMIDPSADPLDTQPATVTVPVEDTATEPTTQKPTDPSGGQSGTDKPGTSAGSPTKTDSDAQTSNETDPKPDEPSLVCQRFSLFSGQFVEDGKDELVSNVAAILVTNTSNQFLDLATINFVIDGKEAVFRVSGLPAGRSAWVLEANRMTATNDSKFTYVSMVTGFRENVISSSDKISITCSGNMLTAKNTTNQTLQNVFVYYRVLHTDGNYFGGITYVVDFGDLAPGASAEKLAGHFSAENSRIVRIGWAGQ